MNRESQPIGYILIYMTRPKHTFEFDIISLSLSLSLPLFLSLFLFPLLCPHPCLSSDSRDLSDMLSRGHRADKAIRCGGLTILAVGSPRLYPEVTAACAGFHTATQIFPHRFRSARIFWSMRKPLQRTVYFFEVNNRFLAHEYAVAILFIADDI
jgi:F/Y-rich N-terminus